MGKERDGMPSKAACSLVLLLMAFLAIQCTEAKVCVVGDRDALLQFKSELQDNYGILSSWDTNPDCCTWLQSGQYRVTTCDSDGRVTSLRLGTALEYKPQPVYKRVNGGEYGASLGSLTSLQLLDIRTLYSGGATVPSSWAHLHKLSNVTLDVLLGGPLPGAVVKNWPLKGLDLANNGLNGTVPAELCKKSLKTLQLSGNNFRGQIPKCLSGFPASSFGPGFTGGNTGLCGAPLPACK